MNKKLKSEAKRVESRERREKLYKKESVEVPFVSLREVLERVEVVGKKSEESKSEEPEKKSANRYEKQVTKLMRLNLDVSVRCGS